MKKGILILNVFIILCNLSFSQSLNWSYLEHKNPTLKSRHLSEDVQSTIIGLANSTYQPQVVLNQQWSGSLGAWLEVSKWEYPAYDDSGRATEYISYSYSDGVYTPASKEIYEYNNGVLIVVALLYQEGTWVNNYRQTYSNYFGEEYDFNVQYDLLIERWDSTEWLPSTNTVIEYDNNGYPEKSLTERYEEGVWKPSLEKTYTYNVDGQLAEQIDQYYNNEGQLLNSGKYEYTYAQNGYVNINTNYYWGTTDWIPSNKTNTDYDSEGNITTSIDYGWFEGSWQESRKYEYHYQDGNFTGYSYYIINEGTWIDYRRLVNTLDANGNVTEHLYQNYTNGTWVNASRLVYTYIEITNVSRDKFTVPNSYSLSQNYPNPFNPSTTIKFSIPKNSFVSLKVYDLLGNELATLISENLNKGDYTATFNAGNTTQQLASGVYFYRMKAGNFIETKKFMLIK